VIGQSALVQYQATIKKHIGLGLTRTLLEIWDIALDKKDKTVVVENHPDLNQLPSAVSPDWVSLAEQSDYERQVFEAMDCIEALTSQLSAEDRMILLLHFSTSFQITDDTLAMVKSEIDSRETIKILESLSGIRCSSCDELENVLDQHLADRLPEEVRVILLQQAEQLRGISISDIARRLGKKRSEVDECLKQIIREFRKTMLTANLDFETMRN
jgi:hypothetical protein